MPLFLEMLQTETADAPERRAAALAGLRAYQAAPRPPRPPLPDPIARSGRATLHAYAATGRPVVFVPSLINPPFVLDLAPDNSLLRWLARQGMRPMLVDWGTPEPGDRDQDIDAHVTQLLLPLLDAVPEPPILVGYCLGGTIAVAAATLRPVAGLTLIAAPWHFAGFGDEARARIAALWERAGPTCAALGLVPMEVLQSGFWRMDPARTVTKFERFGELAPDSPRAQAFVALEDWANSGAPLTYAAGRQLLECFFAADLPGSGGWRIDGRTISPDALACPSIDFVAQGDRIVPAASAVGLRAHHPVAAGHVGMVVGSRAPALLWQPLADWISGVPAAR
ncbi:alpha/beta fold hydrolase [Sphingomonas sp. 3-13AW]